MNHRAGRAHAAALLILVVVLGACSGSTGQRVDPLTKRLADMCGLDPQALSYWGRGAPGFGGPPPYIWQTADFRHSVTLALPGLGASEANQLFVSCDDSHSQQPIQVDQGELPKR